ncbi:hypothetical protein CPB85DRAFT_1437944 [Mucidula mucida]|nr:hypothetical protein CPB85DRAFT_1437944 [Mucidula mucida]
MSLDIESNAVFRRAEWIGKGKKYRDAPLHVMDAFAAEVTMPPTLAQLLPAQEMLVPDLLALHQSQRHFRKFSPTFSPFHAKGFMLLQPYSFLTLLSSKPSDSESWLTISASVFATFKSLQAGFPKFTSAMVQFRKRKQDDDEELDWS